LPLVAVGRIARAHGVRGECRIKLYNEDSEALRAGGEVQLRADGGDPKPFKIERARWAQGGALVKLKGLDDRDRVAALRGAEVLVDSALLPALEDDQCYAFQLVGCTVVDDADGSTLGRVVAVDPSPAHELLRIEQAGREWLLPFVDAYVIEVDVDGQRVRVRDTAELVALAGG